MEQSDASDAHKLYDQDMQFPLLVYETPACFSTNMCSSQQGDCGLSDSTARISLTDKKFKCKKCGAEPKILIQKEHAYCGDCFIKHAIHQFRSTIAKSMMVKKGHRVLIAASGGPSSSAMIQMIRQGLSSDTTHRRIQFTASIIHVDETLLLPDRFSESHSSPQLKEWLTGHDFNCFFTCISQSFRTSDSGYYSTDHTAKLTDASGAEKLRTLLSGIKSGTWKEELLRRVRLKLIVDIAVAEGFDFIFTGSSGTRLSIQLVTDMALGKGNQIDQETCFRDDRHPVPILHPMREFVSKEVTLFNQMSGIPIFTTPNLLTGVDLKQSLGKVTESFINFLDTEFPSTTYCVCRIATKVTGKQGTGEKTFCSLCQSVIDTKDPAECSALTALHLSRDLCNSQQQQHQVPELQHLLCYSCSQIAAESGQAVECLRELCIPRRVTSVRDEISDYLIGDE